MMRSKEKFYWSDALYSARAKDLLSMVEEVGASQLYRCRKCSAFIKFFIDQTTRSGRWQRLKPFEHFQYANRLGQPAITSDLSTSISESSSRGSLCQCDVCASYWWKEEDGWNKADDSLIDA